MHQHVNPLELGKYTLVGEIARGGMGVVYLAETRGPGGFKKMVVVKELKGELADDPNFREMFLEEANLAARLNHRNIVQTNEVGNVGNRYFMAMDYLEGCSLHTARKRLKGDRQLPLPAQLRVVAEVLAGLHYAHELTDYDGTPMGVVHRDVGPQNVFLTYDGQVKLIDFGVAKVLNRQQETQAGVLKGRVAYMAPEQVAGGTIDRRADIFSTGVMLREIVTGQRLWEKLSEIETLKKLITRDIPPFPANSDVPAELREICEKAMAPERDDRFKTAHEMRIRLEQYVLRADPSGSLADLGTHLGRELEGERKRMKEVIAAHLAAGPRGVIPAIGPLVPASGSSPDLTGGSGPHAADGSGPRSGTSATAERAARTPASGTLVSGDLPDAAAPAVAATKEKRRAPLVAAVTVVVVAITALGVVALRRGGERVAAPATPIDSQPAAPFAASAAPAPIAASPATSDQVDTIDVTIRVSPGNAQILIDEAPVSGNPFHARFTRNASATHTIRAVAPGFLPKTELVKFDSNASVAIALERQPFATATPAAAPPRAATPAATQPAALPPAPAASQPPKAGASDINPRGGRPPKRDIDPKDPYGVQ